MLLSDIKATDIIQQEMNEFLDRVTSFNVLKELILENKPVLEVNSVIHQKLVTIKEGNYQTELMRLKNEFSKTQLDQDDEERQTDVEAEIREFSEKDYLESGEKTLLPQLENAEKELADLKNHALILQNQIG